MCSAVDVALRVEPGAQLALRHRVVAAVQHVLLARPDQLDRRARHLLGDGHRLAHPVGRAAPAEAAAEQLLVDLALAPPAGPTPRPSRRARPRRSASASRPRSARASSARWRSSSPSSRGSGTGTSTPPRSCAAAAASAARASPSVADDRLRRVEAGLQHRGDVGARQPWRSGLRPSRSAARRARSWRATRCRRPPRPRCRRRARTFFTPGLRAIAAASKLLSLPPNTGQSLIAAFSMPGSFRSMP